MMKMTYGEQLKHPNWQRVRLEALNRAGWKCEHCGTGDVTLHVHHKRYIKGRMAWEYELTNFVSLCEPCHEEHHAEREKLNRVLAEIPTQQLPEIVSLLVGWAYESLDVDTQVECTSDPYVENIGITARCLEKARPSIYTIANLGSCFGFKEFDDRLRALITELHDRAIGADDEGGSG